MAEGSGSSTANSRPAWLRWSAPSIADAIFVALLATLIFTPMAVRLLGDADIGWQIRTGQLIWSAHAIPQTDPFSSTMFGKPWIVWEWLYDLIVGCFDSWMGLNGVVWFNATVIAAVFAGTLHWLLRRGVHLCAALGFLLVALGASMIHFLARPHLLSWLFTLIWFAILDRSRRESFAKLQKPTRSLWVLPLLMAVWVNLHGAFLVGFVLLAVFWVDALWTCFKKKGGRIEQSLEKIAAAREARELTWVGLMSAAASLLNPHGWKLHSHVWSYLSNRFLMDHIQEFQSPNFHGIAPRCFLVLLLVTLIAVSFRGRTLPISHLLVLLFAAYAGLFAARNIPVSAVLLVLVVGPLLSSGQGHGIFHRMADLQTHLRGHLWPVAATVLILAIAANGGRLGSSSCMNAHFDPKRMPAAAVDYIAQRGISRPVLAPDSWGGYLIYRLHPQTLVVVDDRHDFYGEAFFKSYLNMVQAQPDWQDFLKEHDVRCVLFPRESPLAGLLHQATGWKEIYEDDLAVIFERTP